MKIEQVFKTNTTSVVVSHHGVIYRREYDKRLNLLHWYFYKRVSTLPFSKADDYIDIGAISAMSSFRNSSSEIEKYYLDSDMDNELELLYKSKKLLNLRLKFVLIKTILEKKLKLTKAWERPNYKFKNIHLR